MSKDVWIGISFIILPIICLALNKFVGFSEPYIGVISATGFWAYYCSKNY